MPAKENARMREHAFPREGRPTVFAESVLPGHNCTESLNICSESSVHKNGASCEAVVIVSIAAKFWKRKSTEELPASMQDSCYYRGACQEDAEYGSIIRMCYESSEGEHCKDKDRRALQRILKPTASAWYCGSLC
ncbi:hypothetical protein M514_22295 [Trichuris suis]|uniref:Uncharacterized protein n=1 Tax=Trichuris suis TaxID=68888 RepID=A0A085N7N1_9BILA|nr:hypothetical protein M514_22295 [Trichuris suis]